MGIFSKIFNPYKNLQQFGLSKTEAKELDMLDGKKDQMYEGRSLFDLLQEYSEKYKTYEQINHENKLSFFEYIKEHVLHADLIAAFKMLEQVNVSGIKNDSDEVSDKLIEGFSQRNKDVKDIISKINTGNVVDVLTKYKEKSDEKHTILGVKYDNETLIESILEQKISKEEKKESLLFIKNALVSRIKELTGDAGYTSELFDAAIDKTLNKKPPFQNSKALDSLVDKYLNIIEQLEKIGKKNKKIDFFQMSSEQIMNSPEYEDLKNLLKKEFNLEVDDLLGNGYFDNNALQLEGNCWAHAAINNMLLSPVGRQYINNLIVKSDDKISIYLPGAKDEGLPLPKGDGIYTYSTLDIINGYDKKSVGDGDYTVFMMAVTDYRKESKIHPGDSSDGERHPFHDLIFGNGLSESITISNPKGNKEDWHDLAEHQKFVKHHLGKDQARAYKDFDPYLDVKTRFDNFKNLFSLNQGYFEISLSQGVGQINATNEKGESVILLTNHAYSIVKVNDNSIVLAESNNPNGRLTVDAEVFMNKFFITYCKFPKEIM